MEMQDTWLAEEMQANIEAVLLKGALIVKLNEVFSK